LSVAGSGRGGPEEDVYTTSQVARILRITDRGVRQMIDRGGLEAHQDDGGRHLIPQRAVHALLEDRRVSGVPRTASEAYSSGVRECGTPEKFVGTMPSAPVRAFMRSWFPRTPFHCRAPSELAPCARGRLEILPVLAFPRYGSRSDPQSRFRSMWVRSITGPLGKRSRVAHELRNDVPGSPTRTTGVPNKLLRTLAGRLRRQSTQISRKLPILGLMTPYKEPTGAPSKDYRGAQQGLPGRPAKSTGAPSKKYRGAQQGLPGCPAKSTGVPNKPLSRKVLQNGIFWDAFWRLFVFVSLVVLCC
jgi:excisionase family DNA binding protein